MIPPQPDPNGAPLVSVICACYNMGRYVREAVDSVLAQDYPAVEVIVVDDGSTDDTPAALAVYADNPRVTVIRQANAGQTVAKNAGLRAARGSYVGFCDADNAWLPGKLARQLPLLRTHGPQNGGRVAVVYGDVALIDGEGRPLPTPPVKRHSGRITGPLLRDNFVTFNTTLVPRAVVEEFGGFDESLRMGIDYDLWLRISVKYEFLYLAEPLVKYRIWGGQMSRRTEERFAQFCLLLERFLAAHPGVVSAAEARAAWAYTYVSRGWWRVTHGKRREGWRDFGRAARLRPWDRRLWLYTARALAGAGKAS